MALAEAAVSGDGPGDGLARLERAPDFGHSGGFVVVVLVDKTRGGVVCDSRVESG